MNKEKKFLNTKVIVKVIIIILGMVSMGSVTGCKNNSRAPHSNNQSQQSGNNEPQILPEFDIKGLKGKRIHSSDFQGRYLYVQFIDSESVDDVDLLQQVYLNWIDEDLDIMAIPVKTDQFQARTGIDAFEIAILPDSYRQMRELFKAPPCCNTFYLFDRSRHLVKTGFNSKGYDIGIKTELYSLIKKTAFDISSMIKENDNIENIHWLSQCHQIIRNRDKEYYLISLMTSICSGCYSGLIIQRLIKTHRVYNKSLDVVSIVPDDFSDIDLENLKNLLGIPFHVQRADKLLKEVWQGYIRQFNESDLTNIIFLVDNSGTIVRVTNNDPKRLRDFFIFTQTLLKTGNRGKP